MAVATTQAGGCPVAEAFHPETGPGYADYHEILARARDEEPVFFWPTLGAWVITRYEDVARVANDHENFLKGGIQQVSNQYSDEVVEILDSGPAPWTTTMIMSNVDGEDYARFRGAIGRTFTPRRVTDLLPAIEETVAGLIDSFIDEQRIEFVSRFAALVPAYVIVRFLGLPVSDCTQLAHWADCLGELTTSRVSEERQRYLAGQIVEFQHYAVAQFEQRRERPTDDFLSALLAAAASGRSRVSLGELVNIFTEALVLGGHETTKGAFATGMWHLLSVRERWEALVEDPSTAADVAEEFLRLEPPISGFFRKVANETEVGGKLLKQGDAVFYLSASANHDGSVFADPDDFRTVRPRVAPNMTFGKGLRYCVGAPLARAELTVAFRQLAERIPNARLCSADPPRYVPNPVVRYMPELMIEM